MNASPPRLQDLPRPWARFCLQVGRFAADELGLDFADKHCLVACSGGADSVALLRIALLLCARGGGRVSVAHLDHGLRPESPDDAHFVERLCAGLGLPLCQERQDVAVLARDLGQGLEEAGRTARYAFLERIRQQIDADVILIAHQVNDLAEDQLLRLMRGSGWPALGGMEGRDASRKLLRPLLLCPRSTLEEFLKVLKQDWRTDSSNADRAALRNRVRLDVLPQLLTCAPRYLDGVARLWRQARMDAVHWDAELARLLPEVQEQDGALLIPAPTLRACPAPLRLRLAKAVLEDFGPGQALCDALFELDGLWTSKATGKAVRFPGDKEARVTRQGILLQSVDRKKECG